MNLEHTFVEAVTVRPLLSRSAVGGDPTYGDPVVVMCRVQRKTQTIRTREGTTVESSTTLFSSTAIPRYARVWLPGADTAQVGQSNTVLEQKEDRTVAGVVAIQVAYL